MAMSTHTMATISYTRSLSIEHVLPRNPAPTSIWFSSFSLAEREKWTSHIANLVLLEFAMNNSAKAKDYNIKHSQYYFPMDPSGAPKSSNVRLTDDLLPVIKWSPSELNARNLTLQKLRKHIWT